MREGKEGDYDNFVDENNNDLTGYCLSTLLSISVSEYIGLI